MTAQARAWLDEIAPGAVQNGFHACRLHLESGPHPFELSAILPADFGGPDTDCWFTTWSDPSRPGGYWAQHGQNPEARRWFPFYSGAAITDWLRDCHEYEGRA